jgi:5-methyltetrahydrofolate--homocysteine methyltransferase
VIRLDGPVFDGKSRNSLKVYHPFMFTLQNALRSGTVLLMDGAMGTELQRATPQEGECFELWNLTHPERVKSVHRSYVDAGAQILLTNTFQANPKNLAKYGAADRVREIFQAAIAHARASAGPDRLVLADIGPMERVDAETAALIVGAAETADAVLLETWSDPNTMQFFSDAISAQTACVPLLVSFTFWRPKPDADLGTFAGFSPEDCARSAKHGEATALGVNCGRGLTEGDLLEIVQRYRTLTDLPIFVRPNAGLPTRVGDRWVYPESPDGMAARLPAMLQAGVCMVGGCCGTAPEHIMAFRPTIEEWNEKR